MPSLREMREDIPSIADAILRKMSRAAPAKLDPEAVTALESYPFPGNVRELENILERGLSLAADTQQITADDLHLTPPPEETDAALPAGDYILDVEGRVTKRLRVRAQPFTVVSNETVHIDMTIVTGFGAERSTSQE